MFEALADLHQPEGLRTLIGPRGVRLSGGQVQRSATARMLARMPQLLLLDDVGILHRDDPWRGVDKQVATGKARSRTFRS